MAAQNTSLRETGATEERDRGAVDAVDTDAVASAGDVLLVGDERCTVRLCGSWIAEQFRTRAVSTTRGALENVATGSVDVVVVDDLWLRHSDGELLRRLRGVDERCRTVVLRALNTPVPHADHCVTLPTDERQVLDAIDAARRVTAYERAMEVLLELVHRRRVLRDRGHGQSVESFRLSRRIESLNAWVDDALGDIESRYVDCISDRRRGSSRWR